MCKYILDKNVILCGQFNLGQNVVIFMKSHIYVVFLIILPKGYNYPNCYIAQFSEKNLTRKLSMDSIVILSSIYVRHPIQKSVFIVARRVTG